MKTLKIVAGLLLVFTAGMVVGVVGTRIVIRRVIRQTIKNPGLVRDGIERNLTRKLKLNPTQHAQVEEILTDSQKQMRELRSQFQPQFLTILTNSHDKISAVLKPEQREKFEKLIHQGNLW